MALSRRFLNLIMDNRFPVSKSLRCIDLTHHCNLFNATPPNFFNGSKSTIIRVENRIQLPSPIFNFAAGFGEATRAGFGEDWRMDCLPFLDRRVICADQSGRCFLFEADRSRVVMLPRLHGPKQVPISILIPCPEEESGEFDGGNFYIMDKMSRAGVSGTNQFEAFVYCHYRGSRIMKSWTCQLLPPPPYVYDRTYLGRWLEIRSYVVVDYGSKICISVKGVGTYCMDRRSLTWSHLGKWMLPFIGKVEYVPEVKLWVGICSSTHELAAADLSSMDSQPQLVGTCKEFEPPEEWKQCRDPQLVNLGSGKFCVTRFFRNQAPKGDSDDEFIGRNITVLTGVEVMQSACHGNGNGNGNGSSGEMELQMIPHRSRWYGGDTIGTVC
ncbi:hypothetical protein [Oryza sativa Japonica Group]|uniref:Uncharacterized protein n=2 Tax=Oryza sativa subsp. japonica TaxID=39947 RepID=Q7F0C4_ORYSJ|nr:hypothetical protein OsJ_04628 [Oryza sativa Japonica Group]BAB90743.1 hypothetical protein [Oryza sativa Japonica Group]BAB92905.1 hypothetical protein [Oryza sativa Japonica Group]BAS76006.1 Os01g0927800 [Oryza sativa Japonica Group]